MKQRILALLGQGRTYTQIVAEIGCAKSTVAYHAKSVKEPPNYKVHDWAEVQKFYDGGHSGRQCKHEFDICNNVWYNSVKSGKIKLRADHRIPLDTLIKPERNTGRSHLKGRLLAVGLLQSHCTECGLSEWRGKPLALHLHHVNGIHNDNSLENLQLLCPNCHSQTSNYSGRNVSKSTKL